MIVVAIVAILGSIAYPAYKDSILKGRRAQARTALAELLQQQERMMTQSNCYVAFSTSGTTSTPLARAPAGACGGGTPTFPTFPFKNFSGDSQQNSAYILSADHCPTAVAGTNLSIADCVRVVATPRDPGSDPVVNVLQMTSTGVKTCTGSASGDPNRFRLCWP
jgi:type IV pilus assembly protein PilE